MDVNNDKSKKQEPNSQTFPQYYPQIIPFIPAMGFPFHIGPSNMMNMNIQEPIDIENLMQGHHRKLLRRAANKKSAQLSRARKKSKMEEMKGHIELLRHFRDVLHSIPDYIFTMNQNGYVSHITPRTHNFLKDCIESTIIFTHIKQIFTNESFEIVTNSLLIAVNEQTKQKLEKPETQKPFVIPEIVSIFFILTFSIQFIILIFFNSIFSFHIVYRLYNSNQIN